MGRGRAVVPPPLEGVLQFQPQLPGQRSQVGALDAWHPAGRLAGPGELRQVGPAMLPPALGVDPAQR